MNRLVLLGGAAAVLASSTSAQVASAVLREGDALAGALAGQTVASISGTGANNNAGYVAVANSSGGLGFAWGTADGTAPGILQVEGTIGPLTQTSFEGFIGISDAGIPCYSAGGTGGPVGGFDSVWYGNSLVAVEGDPHPTLAGQFWRFGSRPGVTATGLPYFVGGITSTAGGNTENRGLFYGLDGGTVLVLGGDVIPNLPEPLSTSASLSFDFRVSASGTNYIYEAGMTGVSVSTANDNAMVLSGTGLLLGGSLVQEGTPVPAAIGGLAGENWDNFDYMGVTDSGAYFFTGDTDAATTSDEIIVVNGAIAYREGDVIDGKLIDGSIESAAMNESGNVAYVWDFDDMGTNKEALFLDDRCVLAEGEEVDWDGDGIIDAGHVVTDFTGIAALSVGSTSVLYFTADVDVLGTVLEGLFALEVPSSYPSFCFGDGTSTPCPCGNVGAAGEGCANSTGAGMICSASGDAVVGADTLVLSASQCPPNVPGLFFQANTTQANPPLLGDGLLCITGGIQRLGVTFTDGNGDLLANPNVSVVGGVSPGDTRYYQLWTRDVTGPCGQGSNTSNAVQVDWQ